MIKRLCLPTNLTPFMLVVYQDDSIETFNDFESIPIDIKPVVERILTKWILELTK